jgi:hypothetical protein
MAAVVVAARETSHLEAPGAATEQVNTPIEDAAAVAEAAIEETTVMSGTAIATPLEDTKTVKAPEIASIAVTEDIIIGLILVALRNRARLIRNATAGTRILREGLTMDPTTRLRATSRMKNRGLDLGAIDENLYA